MSVYSVALLLEKRANCRHWKQT